MEPSGFGRPLTGRLNRTLPGGRFFVSFAVFSPDRRTVLTASGQPPIVELYDVPTGRLTLLPSAHQGEITALAVSPDGKAALSADDRGMARLWDIATGTTKGEPLRHEGSIWTAAFGPDGRSVVTASADKTTRLWDAATGQAFAPLLENEEPALEVAFSADSQTIAIRTAHSVRTFARLSGQGGAKLLGPPWQPRESKANWGFEDGAVKLQREGIRTLGVGVMALSPDGTRVLATCEGSEARLLRVPSPVVGNVERLALWVQVLTGRELDAGGVVHELDPQTLSERRQRLEQLGALRCHEP